MVTEQAQRQYQDEAGARYHFGKRAIPPAAVPWVARLRAEKIAPHISPSDTLLEYGAGFGWNLIDLRCARKLAFDLQDLLTPEARAAGVEFVPELKSVAPSSIDAILCHHALEHLPHPALALEEISRLLRPGGKLLLHVPYEREAKYRHFNPAEPNHHLYSWNAQTLGNLVQTAGFQILEAGLGEFGYDRFASSLAARWNIGEPGYRFVRRVAHLLKPALEVRLSARRPTVK